MDTKKNGETEANNIDSIVDQIISGQATVERDDNQEMMADFISETKEHLENIESNVLDLEREPENVEMIHGLFREFHTIKGLAGFVNQGFIQKIAHQTETLLDDCRKGKTDINKSIVDLILASSDCIKKLCDDTSLNQNDDFIKKAGDHLVKLSEILNDNQPTEEILDKFDNITDNIDDSETSSTTTTSNSEGIEEQHNQYISAFQEEMQLYLDTIEQILLSLENEMDNKDMVDELFRAIQTIEGMASAMGFYNLTNLTHKIRNVLQEVTDDNLVLNQKLIDLLFVCHDNLVAYSNTIIETESEASIKYEDLITKLNNFVNQEVIDNKTPLEIKNNELFNYEKNSQSDIIIDQTEGAAENNKPMPEPGSKIGEIMVKQGIINKEQLEDLLEKQKNEYSGLKLGQVAVMEKIIDSDQVIDSLLIQDNTVKSLGSDSENVRVSITKIDNLVDMVGELLINQALIEQEASNHFDNNDYFMTNLVRTERIAKDIQNIAMSLRMVSLRTTFQKINRMARDTIGQVGKNICFQMEGEETEIDRRVAEKILDPLIHLVKNAISHGIEMESSRTSQGKPAQGIVKVMAYSKRGNVFIEVSDDGRGMTTETIYQKALEKKLIDPSVSYSPDEILNLIFLPGFSTTEMIDNISGRGVGLDVVRTEMLKIGGKVEINNSPGHGCTFTLKIPINFAVINGIIITINKMQFIIPILNVRQIYQAKAEQWIRTRGNRVMVTVRDEVIPVIPIFKIFGLESGEELVQSDLIIILELEQKVKALPIHGIIGRREIVIKPLGSEFSSLQYIAGTSILGDGKVSLIFDIENLFRMEEMLHESSSPIR